MDALPISAPVSLAPPSEPTKLLAVTRCFDSGHCFWFAINAQSSSHISFKWGDRRQELFETGPVPLLPY